MVRRVAEHTLHQHVVLSVLLQFLVDFHESFADLPLNCLDDIADNQAIQIWLSREKGRRYLRQ